MDFEENLRGAIADQLAQALAAYPLDKLANPTLRLEVFVQDGSDDNSGSGNQEFEEPDASRKLILSVCLLYTRPTEAG